MSTFPLRRILTLQPIEALLFPFGVAALVGYFWIVPQIKRDAESRQLQIARAIASQVQSYLDTSTAIVGAAASIHHDLGISGQNHQHLMDGLLSSADSLGSLYIVKPDGRISSIALGREELKQEQDLKGLDLSRNALFRAVAQSGQPGWSEAFLSVITGGLSAAYALPGDGVIVVGEVDLGSLTRFLKQVSGGNDLVIMIVDGNGQVIADHDGRHTAQQLNIGNIPIVRRGIDSDLPTTGRFDFSGARMTGSMIQIPVVDWHVLVAQQDGALYRTVVSIAWIVLACILTALLCAVGASIYLARKLAGRFDALALQARTIARGDRTGAWPVSSIAEFNQLSDTLKTMADTLHRQELDLRESENRTASLYTISQYPFSDEASFLDHALDEIVRLTSSAIGYIYFYNEHTRQFILHSWSNSVMKDCSVQEQKTVYDLDSTGIWGEAVRQRKPILLNDFARHDPLKKGLPEGHVPLKRFLTVPVIADDAIVAVAGVANKSGDYLESDVMQLTLFMDAVWKIVNRKRGEAERRKLEQQLLYAQKLESLGVLAGGIAHDFNNILTAIIGNADLALMRVKPESPAVDNLQRIGKAASRAADLARQMLAYSGKGKFMVGQLDLNSLLEEMLHILQVSISKKAELRLNLTRPLPAVEADVAQMHQIIMNLVINASEALGDENGVIAVTTGQLACDQDYLKNDWLTDTPQGGQYVYLEISDDGCGMDQDTLTRLFDPFFTTKFTGRGLGMAAVLGIVRGHQGSIKVDSQPGQGTTFRVLLPASGGQPDISPDRSETEGWRGGGTVLLYRH